MATNSSSGGFLSPSLSPAPLEGDALNDFFHDWFLGLTGFVGDRIRPRWQPDPPNIPEEGVDWLAFGVHDGKADVNAAELHNPSGTGYNEFRRHEELSVKVSFYGPNARRTAGSVRDASAIAQNREVLSLNSFGLIECGSIASFPEMIKQKWYNRADMHIRFRRQIVRHFDVQNLVAADIVINTLTETVAISTN